MPEAILQQVLEPFFTTKPRGKGTGLGLPSVVSFARSSGGFVTISSKPSQGTTVSIYLPRAVDNTPEQSAPTPVHGAVPMGDGELILVVEDDKLLREVTLRRLEGLGYVVEEAASGVEAIRLLQAGIPFAAVLSDVVMPGGVDGCELARWISANQPGLGVVLCSGHSHAQLQAASPQWSFSGTVLTKPFTREHLAVAIAQSLEASVMASRLEH
jgi:CheY-like chemotaxis protein